MGNVTHFHNLMRQFDQIEKLAKAIDSHCIIDAVIQERHRHIRQNRVLLTQQSVAAKLQKHDNRTVL